LIRKEKCRKTNLTLKNKKEPFFENVLFYGKWNTNFLDKNLKSTWQTKPKNSFNSDSKFSKFLFN